MYGLVAGEVGFVPNEYPWLNVNSKRVKPKSKYPFWVTDFALRYLSRIVNGIGVNNLKDMKSGIVLLNWSLLEEFIACCSFRDKNKRYKTKSSVYGFYSRNILAPLLSLGVIKYYRDDFLYKKGTAKTFSINIEKLLDSCLVNIGKEALITDEPVNTRTILTEDLIDKVKIGMSKSVEFRVNSEIVNSEHIYKLRKWYHRRIKMGKSFLGRTLLPCDCTDFEIGYVIYTENESWRENGILHETIKDSPYTIESIAGLNISIHRGEKGFVSKIGCRGYNNLCATRSYIKHPEIPYNGSRENVLDDFFGEGNWSQYDVTASIPKILMAKRNGVVLNPDEDFYEDVRSVLAFNYERWEIKQCTVRSIFSVSKKDYLNKIKRRYMFDVIAKLEVSYRNYDKLPKDTKKSLIRRKLKTRLEKEDAMRELKMSEDIFDIINKRINLYGDESAVFLDETVIYDRVRKRLCDNKIKNGLVYDCFFYDNTMLTESRLKEIIMEEIYDYFGI